MIFPPASWGWNPVVTRFGPETVYYLSQAKKAGAKIICVDPRYTASAKALAEQWIPVRPGTDTALLIAMAHVIISEDLLDRRFIETYTVGFERFRDYVLGKEDGMPRGPAWAEDITGVPWVEIDFEDDLEKATTRIYPRITDYQDATKIEIKSA